jgi:plasmid replication initiation protein
MSNFKINGKDQFVIETDKKSETKDIFGLTRNWIYRDEKNPAFKDLSKREVFFIRAKDTADAVDHMAHWFPLDERWLLQVDEKYPKDKIFTCCKVEPE